MLEEEQAEVASMFSSPAHPKKAYLKEIKLYFLLWVSVLETAVGTRLLVTASKSSVEYSNVSLERCFQSPRPVHLGLQQAYIYTKTFFNS